MYRYGYGYRYRWSLTLKSILRRLIFLIIIGIVFYMAPSIMPSWSLTVRGVNISLIEIFRAILIMLLIYVTYGFKYDLESIAFTIGLRRPFFVGSLMYLVCLAIAYKGLKEISIKALSMILSGDIPVKVYNLIFLILFIWVVYRIISELL